MDRVEAAAAIGVAAGPTAVKHDPIPQEREALAMERLAAALGPKSLLVHESDVAPYVSDWRGLFHGRSPFVLRPRSVEDVSTAMRTLAQERIAVVPQGGNTSLVGGATPDETGRQAVLSLSRMDRIRDIDPVGMTMTADAGVIVRSAQDAAREAGCLFPLSFGAEGTATIGGALSTNAGGNTAIRYGSARDLVLGLEVVLADGSIWNGLRTLRKDNTGYGLRQLFIGSEGTLGIITGAVLRLFPVPRSEQVALCAVPELESVLALFRRLQREDDAVLRSFEYISGEAMDLALAHVPGCVLPVSARARHYVLVDLASTRRDADLRNFLERNLADALEEGEIVDAAIAQTGAQAAAIWKLREEQSEAQRLAGANIKNDVAVPVSRVPELIERAVEEVGRLVPGTRSAPFGHVGDGNIHLNFVQPPSMPGEDFLARGDAIMDCVNGIVRSLGGSFSAEHGIGRLKVEALLDWHSPVEMRLMQSIKRCLDPDGFLNPGKVVA